LKRRLALTQRGAAGGFDLAGALASTRDFESFGRTSRMPLSSKVSRIAAIRKLKAASSSPSPPE
jgi:hypothetical protein